MGPIKALLTTPTPTLNFLNINFIHHFAQQLEFYNKCNCSKFNSFICVSEENNWKTTGRLITKTRINIFSISSSMHFGTSNIKTAGMMDWEPIDLMGGEDSLQVQLSRVGWLLLVRRVESHFVIYSIIKRAKVKWPNLEKKRDLTAWWLKSFRLCSMFDSLDLS